MEACNYNHSAIAYVEKDQEVNEHAYCPMCNANKIIELLQAQIDAEKKRMAE